MPKFLEAPETIAEDKVPVVTLPPKVLLWPAAWWGDHDKPDIEADLTIFPERHDRYGRREGKMSVASLEFRLALRGARRLWILDPHFDIRFGIRPLQISLVGTGIEQLLINGGKGGIQPGEARQAEAGLRAILSDNLGGKTAPLVEWRDDLAKDGEPDTHDRFAIVDNELWHFGATVGGSHPSINAFSRGWNAAETGAIRYFTELWRGNGL